MKPSTRLLLSGAVSAALLVGAPALAGASTGQGLQPLPTAVAKTHHIPSVPHARAVKAQVLQKALLNPKLAKASNVSPKMRRILRSLRRETAKVNPGAKTHGSATASDVLIGYVGSNWYNPAGNLYQGMDWYEYYSGNIGYYYAAYEWSYGPVNGQVWDGVEQFYVPLTGLFYGPYLI